MAAYPDAIQGIADVKYLQPGSAKSQVGVMARDSNAVANCADIAAASAGAGGGILNIDNLQTIVVVGEARQMRKSEKSTNA
jgi:hypothetical protein